MKPTKLIEKLEELIMDKYYYPHMGDWAMGKHEVHMTVHDAISFIKTYIPDLLQAVGEELLSVKAKHSTDFQAQDELVKLQRSRLKEIIQEVGK